MKFVTLKVVIKSTGFDGLHEVDGNEYLYGCEMKI
jgi:hypothetical protein